MKLSETVLLEGVTVILDNGNIPFAAAMLFVFIYALHLSYPPELRYTFEIIQIFSFQLDANQLP